VTAYLSALAVCAASIAAGAALCCRSGEWSWTAPPVGLAALMLLALATVRLPGHGTTAAIAVGLATIVAVAVVVRRWVALLPLAAGLPVGGVVLAVCSLPFIANDRIGELGGWINNDLAFHMGQAEALASVGSAAHITSPGYPNGPHALAAVLDVGLGVGPSAAFTGILLATPVLMAVTALGALGDIRWYLRLPAAALTGIAYLSVSYFAQGAFKEPLLALFLLGFVVALRDVHDEGRRDARLGLALIVTTAGGVAVFGIMALAWPAVAVLWLGALELLGGWRPDPVMRRRLRRWLPAIGALTLAGCVALVLIAVTGDFFDNGPGRYLTSNEPGGNFSGQLSPLEALGVWHRPDFRESFGNGLFGRSGLFEPGALLACAVVAFGLWWCWRRREWALLSGALAGVTVYVVVLPFTLAYFSGKALVVVAPLLTLLGVKALATVSSSNRARVAAIAVLGAYLLAAGASSTLALRGTHVRPAERGHDLAAFRSIVDGQPTIYLGRDNFAPWELRGARLLGFQSNSTGLALKIDEVPKKRTGEAHPPAADVDSVAPWFLAVSARYLVTPRTAYASRPPAEFRPIKRTRWHVLWERREPLKPREILAEGEAPGKVLDCRTARARRLARRRGVAYVRPAPVVGRPGAWVGGTTVASGGSRKQELRLGRGLWDISLRYFSDVPLRLKAGALDASLPPYVSDESTFFSAGRVVSDGETLRVTVTVPDRRRIELVRFVRLGTVAATRVDDLGRVVPLASACGKYVDWLRVSP
jgi:hypothetical protein